MQLLDAFHGIFRSKRTSGGRMEDEWGTIGRRIEDGWKMGGGRATKSTQTLHGGAKLPGKVSRQSFPAAPRAYPHGFTSPNAAN